MRRNLSTRFWIEAGIAGLGTLLFLVTLITREWFEALTGLDPDGGSGALEFALAFGLLAIAIVSTLLARSTYRRETAAQ